MKPVRVRPALSGDAAALGRVHVAGWRETYAGIMPADYLAALSAAPRAERWAAVLAGAGPALHVHVADAPGAGIVGFAVGGRERSGHAAFDGELQAIYVERAHHRRGVGRMLVEAVATALAAEGRRAMLLWVLEANPACGFYERLGAERLGLAKPAEFGRVTLREIAYGWRSLPDLIELCAGEERDV